MKICTGEILPLSSSDLIRKHSELLSIKVGTGGDFTSILLGSHKISVRAALNQGLYRGTFFPIVSCKKELRADFLYHRLT